VVGAVESERRRIERALHDGTQARLVSVAMSLGVVDAKLPSDPKAAKRIAREAHRVLAAALAEVRQLSQGIYPVVLTERGLPAALSELADHAALPASLVVSIKQRLSVDVEAAAYFVVSESVANAVKHSHGTAVRITALREARLLRVEVADDGTGGADSGRGSGLRGLTDRVEALGGRLILTSPRGHGTTVRALIPAP
jgi:signal transduction histidine kinase